MSVLLSALAVSWFFTVCTCVQSHNRKVKRAHRNYED